MLLSDRDMMFDYLMTEAAKCDGPLPIKMLIADLGETSKVFNWMLRKTNMYPSFGRTHLDLTVGNMIIGWNSSSLCIPREGRSERAVILVTVCELKKEKISDALFNLAQEIVKWNVGATYGVVNNTARKFVEACLCAMNVRLNFRGEIKDYLTDLYTVERVTRTLKLSASAQEALSYDFLQDFGVNNGQITFTTHRQLDEFYYAILNEFPEFLQESKNRYIVSIAMQITNSN
jgi:hypothetical protein